MPEAFCTPAQRRQVAKLLGLDPDLTISISLAADWGTATLADTHPDGQLRMTDGQLATRILSGPVADPPTDPADDQEAPQ